MSASERTALGRFSRAAARHVLAFLTSPGFTKMVGEGFFTLAGRRFRGNSLDLRRVRKVLVIRLDNIGDVILTTPLLRQVRQHLPGAYITALVRPQCTELLEYCPHVDEVIGFEWQLTTRFQSPQRHWQAAKLAFARLWFRRFDLVLLPRWGDDYRSEALIAYMSGAQWRVGFRDDRLGFAFHRKEGRDSLLTHVLKGEPAKHEVEQHMEVLRFLGAETTRPLLELWTSPQDEVFASQLLRQRNVDPGQLLVALGVGASHPKRLWPIARYAALASWLVDVYGARILVIGGEHDKALGRFVHQHVGEDLIDLTCRTTLRQAGSLLRLCAIFIGNDSGPMHLATAAGIPVIGISCHPRDGSVSHANSPKRFRPWAVQHQMLQPEKGLDSCRSACLAEGPHCVTGVTIPQVKRAVEIELRALARMPRRASAGDSAADSA